MATGIYWRWRRVRVAWPTQVAEVLRYGIVGLLLNTGGYLLYLVVTAMGVTPLATVLMLYPASVVAGYFAHRRHTFKRPVQGLEAGALIRYIAVYIAGFLMNAGLLEVFYLRLGIPHQIVQFAAIFVVAGFLFVAMKFLVFADRD